MTPAGIAKGRLEAVIAFDRETLADPRPAACTLSAAFGALSAANAAYLQVLHQRARLTKLFS